MSSYRVFLSICLVVLASTLAVAATDTETITINATVGDHAKRRSD